MSRSCAILLSHTSPFSSYSATASAFIVNTIFRWAVPFFFVASGYFMPTAWKTLAHNLFRILLLYVLWSAIHFLVRGVDLRSLPFSLFPENSYVPAFWFFPSLLACQLFTFVLKKVFRNRYILLLPITFSLFLLACLGDSYYYLCPDLPTTVFNARVWAYTTRNGLMFGTFFLCLGSSIKDLVSVDLLWQYVSKKALACCAFIGLCCSFFEYWIYRHFQTGLDFNVTFSSIPLCLAVFLLALEWQIPRDISLILRHLSTLLYVIHPLFTSFSFLREAITNSILYFFSILFLSLALSLIIIFLSQKAKFLRFLY